jgi:zinc protease
VPFVTVRLGLLAGAWTEQKPGTASMAMQMLTKGTTKHSEAQLADELDTYAISVSGHAGMDTSGIHMSCLTSHIDRAMALLGEVAMLPTFPETEFDKLKRQVLTSLAVTAEEPQYIAERQLRRVMYADHCYSRTAAGEIEDVNALANKDLRPWYEKFARPDMAVLIFAGDIEPQQAFELARKTFASWKSTGKKPDVKQPAVPDANETHIYLVDRPASTQSQIRIAQPGITRHDDGYFVSRVVSSYFGGAFNSRLNEKVRVKKGLTYGIWGGYTARRFAGEFRIGTFSKTESTAEAIRAALQETQRLKSDGPSKQELENTQTYILGSFVRQRETPQQVAGDLWLIESQDLGEDYLDRLLARVAKTESADCIHLTSNTVTPDKLTIVVVGDAEKLREELEKIAPVTVVAKSKTK